MSALGKQIDVWAALVPGRGAYARQVEQKVIDKMQARGLAISREMVSLEGRQREHVLVQLKIRMAAVATVAVRITGDAGGDLEMSWRLFEGLGSGMWAVGVGALLVLLGLPVYYFATLFSPTGVSVGDFLFLPVIVVGAIIAFGLVVRKITTSPLRSFEKVDSQKLAVQVDYALMTALDEVGIDRAEVRVLSRSQLLSQT